MCPIVSRFHSREEQFVRSASSQSDPEREACKGPEAAIPLFSKKTLCFRIAASRGLWMGFLLPVPLPFRAGSLYLAGVAPRSPETPFPPEGADPVAEGPWSVSEVRLASQADAESCPEVCKETGGGILKSHQQFRDPAIQLAALPTRKGAAVSHPTPTPPSRRATRRRPRETEDPAPG